MSQSQNNLGWIYLPYIPFYSAPPLMSSSIKNELLNHMIVLEETFHTLNGKIIEDYQNITKFEKDDARFRIKITYAINECFDPNDEIKLKILLETWNEWDGAWQNVPVYKAYKAEYNANLMTLKDYVIKIGLGYEPDSKLEKKLAYSKLQMIHPNILKYIEDKINQIKDILGHQGAPLGAQQSTQQEAQTTQETE